MTGDAGSGGRRRRLPALLAGVVVLGLTAAALLAPQGPPAEGRLLVVVDPLGRERAEAAFGGLAAYLEPGLEGGLRLAVVRDGRGLAALRRERIALVLCPTGVALSLPEADFAPLAAALGRRPGPEHQRAVLLRRRGVAATPAPWLSAPGRTVVGDSLSLSGLGAVCRDGGRPATPPAFGPDPYDHAPALQALRLGCFDYAVVREGAVVRMEASGLLAAADWARQDLGEPAPDVLVLASRRLPARGLVRLSEGLVGLGRVETEPEAAGRAAAALAGLATVRLSGFEAFLEPEVRRLRERYDRCWPGLVF